MQHSHRDSKGRFVSAKGTNKTKKEKSQNNKSYSTDITVILDRSGSMSSCKSGMKKAFDSFITEQRNVKGECKVSLIQFDSYYEPVYSDLDISQVPNLCLQPRNMTALYDAIGKTITSMNTKYSTRTFKPFDKIICIIITDGHENASSEYSLTKVSQMIKESQNKGWQFVFLGANIDVDEVGKSLDIKTSAMASYQSTNNGTQCVMQNLNNAVKRYRTSDNGIFALTDEEKARMASGKF